jgi:hypothetical protein
VRAKNLIDQSEDKSSRVTYGIDDWVMSRDGINSTQINAAIKLLREN